MKDIKIKMVINYEQSLNKYIMIIPKTVLSTIIYEKIIIINNISNNNPW